MANTYARPVRLRAPAPPPGGARRFWKIGAAVAAALALVVGIFVMQQPAPEAVGKITVIVNVDGNVAGNGVEQIADQVSASAAQLASSGGGSLQVIVASGGAAAIVATVDLAVDREGQPETDAEVRDRVVAERVSGALEAARTAHPATPGRDFLGLLIAAAEQAPPADQHHTVFYVGFGLGTLDPADVRVAIAAEPSWAVQSIEARLPKMAGADLHVVFPSAAGPQQELNAATAAWREEYWRQIGQTMGANIVEITSTHAPAGAEPGAAPAPVIPNIPDPTPVPPVAPGHEPVPDPQPVVIAGSSFVIDDDLFVDEELAKSALAPMVAAWNQHPEAYSGATCIGRTAAFGPPDTARDLSDRRAGRPAGILLNSGISPVSTEGVGFDDPLPDYPPTAPEQRSVICSLIPK